MRIVILSMLLSTGAILCAQQQSAPAPVKVANAKTAPSGSSVVVRGAVSQYRAPTSERAPHSVTIKDDSGELRVPIWEDVWKKIEFREKLKSAGTLVTARVKVSEFHGEPEGRVLDAADIKEGTVSIAPLTPIIWIEDLQEGMKQATAAGKDIFIFYSAADAENSQFLETKVLQEPKAIRAITDKYVPVRIDIIKQPRLATQLGIYRGGVFALYRSNGSAISLGPISSVRSADDLLKALTSP
ncbi:MAG: thioredoxin family protein [Candidatus Sumerlaeaceae bacterium]